MDAAVMASGGGIAVLGCVLFGLALVMIIAGLMTLARKEKGKNDE
jgi:hypothetical protein